ncbi:MAG: glycolate oxidase subunit GlcF [bacterium]
MHAEILPELQATARGVRAQAILGQCVHCGFCNATCPTYQLLGDELDGPRGRIYQMKSLLEGALVANADGDNIDSGDAMRKHLDRCLSCRNCEVTCPSGVRYGALLEIGQAVLEEKFPRPFAARWRRRLFARAVSSRRVFAATLRIGRWSRSILPRALAQRVADAPTTRLAWPPARHSRRMIALAGCVQPSLAPNTNAAAAQVLDRLGISLREIDNHCCGAVQLHAGGDAHCTVRGRAAARALVDRCAAHLDRGAEAMVMTASGCGLTVKEYPALFADQDSDYRDKARRVSEHTFDLAEVIARELPRDYASSAQPPIVPRKVAFHAPCTLQHGQRVNGAVEEILTRVGHEVRAVADAHQCCGSAGAYSIWQPRIASQLRVAKQDALAAAGAEVVCTANVGCQAHLSIGARAPVAHWIELLL